jgi:hypothetical protein
MSAQSDVKLVSGQVIVDAWDLCLDSPDRRPNPQANPNPNPDSSRRRALVHDFDDGLTMNWDDDYPNGVTLKGVRVVEGHGQGANKKTEFKHSIDFRGNRVDCFTKLRFVASATQWAEISTENAKDLIIENKGGLGDPGKVVFKSAVQLSTVSLSKALKLPTGAQTLVKIDDLVSEILSLRKRISDLEQKVH